MQFRDVLTCVLVVALTQVCAVGGLRRLVAHRGTLGGADVGREQTDQTKASVPPVTRFTVGATGQLKAAVITATQTSFNQAPERYPEIHQKVQDAVNAAVGGAFVHSDTFAHQIVTLSRPVNV
jgi:hypothetical protein